MNIVRVALQTRPLSASKNASRCRKCLTGLRHYAAARPLKADSGGMSNLQMILVTGGVSYFAAHAVYVAWSDHLASQKSHPVTNEEHEKEADVADDEDPHESFPEEVVQESLSQEDASKTEEVIQESPPPEAESKPEESLPLEDASKPEVVQESLPQEAESKPEESLPLEDSSKPEVVQESLSLEAENKPDLPEVMSIPEPSQQPQTVKDVFISSDPSVNIVVGAPVPRHSVDSHPPSSSDSGPKDIIITQSK